MLQRVGKSFDDYFQHQPIQPTSIEGQPGQVTDSELGQYMHFLFSRDILSTTRFNVQKEGQIDAVFLHDLEGEIIRRGQYMQAHL